MAILSKLINLYKKSGFVLTVFRLPSRSFFIIRTKMNTLYWKLFLKKVGKQVVIEPGVNFENPTQVRIGNNVYIGKGSHFGSELHSGSLTIEDNVHIGYFNKIDHTGNIVIERGTLFSENVKIYTHSHGYDPRSKPVPKDLIIKRNCWIGSDVTVLESVGVIESRVIIGASSLVVKQCEIQSSIYAGVPCRYIKNL